MADFNLDDTGKTGGNGKETNGGPAGNSGPAGGTGRSEGGVSDPERNATEAAPKRRGRKPFPRDANGNIVRDAPGTTSDKSGKVGVGLGGFKLNDRNSIRQQIQGIHMAVAVITKQPVFALNDVESVNLTNALCDVLDYHEINITEAGGPYGLYLSLIIVVFGIYKPRVDIILSGATIVGMDHSKPTSPGEVVKPNSKGGMDFSGDVDTNETAH